MIEQGLSMYIQAGLAALVPPVVAAGAFFGGQLPTDQIQSTQGGTRGPMAFAYKSVNSKPEYVLNTQTGWTEWQVQINCHGSAQADAIILARAIDKVLRGGFKGTFPDPDSTYVFGLFRLGSQVDGFNDPNRSYVRSLEYEIQYQQI